MKIELGELYSSVLNELLDDDDSVERVMISMSFDGHSLCLIYRNGSYRLMHRSYCGYDSPSYKTLKVLTEGEAKDIHSRFPRLHFIRK